MPITRTSRLSVRASPSELTHWNSVARKLGHTTTTHWIRALLTASELTGHDNDSQKICSELYGLRQTLSRIGNNLNQLAHSAHCGDAVQCESVLGDLEIKLHQIDSLLARSRNSPSPTQVRPVWQDSALKAF
ncbi:MULTISPECIES: plasmid mobilization relaxosome protein MobC [Acetobacter]|uniref:Bacterial mobilisation domain-containing protein n=1 Tax=Acetobacter tropicalis TaxID=104102 RepID=A0A149TUD5_9PROT|nr:MULTISPECIES: plasmid mobilization relaxosome protein MobC [Acetobacter]KXV56748.1 hypothetical protein AD947_10440 [Acetobacter tropicalis]